MFDNGDPWDLLVKITVNLEELIQAHNKLQGEYLHTRKKLAIVEARVDEMKRKLANAGQDLDHT
jgi:hypothetical protein